ncbi:MAG: CoA pyrophosphatase [Gemmatimonadaceae bacterium]
MTDPATGHPLLQRIRQALREQPGRMIDVAGTPARAAVALVFRVANDDLELLVIRRAERVGDPWSGQMALPGGRFDATDADLLDTAVRETWEETAVDLRAMGESLGMLDELHPRTPVLPSIVIRPYVFALTGPASITLSAEVAAVYWVPLRTLQDPAVSRESVVSPRGEPWRVSSFIVHDQVVWGLTERILRNLLSRIE